MPPESVPERADFGTFVAARPGDTLGYPRVSTNDQNPEAQNARLIEAGAIRVFSDVVSGKRFDRPGLAELKAYVLRLGIGIVVANAALTFAIVRLVAGD